VISDAGSRTPAPPSATSSPYEPIGCAALRWKPLSNERRSWYYTYHRAPPRRALRV